MTGKRKTQCYWVETQAQDGEWSPCIPNRQVYQNSSRPFLMKDADQAVKFMEHVAAAAQERRIRIAGVRVMQIDPNDNKNLYHLGTANQPQKE